MATIVKTNSGTWKALVRKTGWPPVSKSFRTKRDAIDWGRRIEDEMVRGLYIQRAKSQKMTLADAFARYSKEILPMKAESTQQRDAKRISLLVDKFGKYSLASLTVDLIAQYRDERLAQGKSNNTVRLDLALLQHLYSIAIKEWHIGLASNPVQNVRKPSPGEGRNRRLSAKEEETLFSVLDKHSNPMLGWIAQIAIETGMRKSEILNLHLQQVNIERRLVRLDKTKNGSTRTVPLTKKAVNVFKLAVENPWRPDSTTLIFYGEPSKEGVRKPYEFNKLWVEAKKSIGLADIHFHDLRHEAVSRLVEAGLTDQEVAAISGHKSMQMLRRYTHLRAEDLVQKLDKVNIDKAS